jgi:single-strand DNA-binding protein
MAQGRFFGNIIGNLGRDPDLKVTQSGTKICKFNIAINSKHGEVEYCTWIRATAFDKTAELCQQYLHKGMQVDVLGDVDLRQYTGRDGSPRYSIDIAVYKINWSDRKEVVDEPQPAPAAVPESSTASITDDDIPF